MDDTFVNDINFEAPNPRGRAELPAGPRAPVLSFLDGWFDAHSGGAFAKRLLIVMLLIATCVQPFSIIYTAYGDKPPATFWQAIPALAFLLFIALDWTILPLGYFFATTRKPGLKIILLLLLAVVAFGAFEGYFTATERLISMRVREITAIRLNVEQAEAKIADAKSRQKDLLHQQADKRVEVDKDRAGLIEQIAQIDQQITAEQAATQAENTNETGKITEIRKACRVAVDPNCMRDKLAAEQRSHSDVQAKYNDQLKTLQAAKEDLNAKLAGLNNRDDNAVDSANQAVAHAQDDAAKVLQQFVEAVLNNQVYRWAGVLYGESPRDVTAEQANKVLDIFAAAVALAYVLTQILLSISYYGRGRVGLVETNREFLRERVVRAWERVTGARRAYWARKRRGVYRDIIKEVPTTVYQDREVVKEVPIPTAERTRIVYVPVPPGGPVPPAEEFVSKANFGGGA